MYISAIFALCIVALVGGYPHPEVSEETKTLAAEHQACFDQNGITLEQLEQLANNPPPDMSNSGMCFINCVLESKGLEKDGVLQVDAVVSKRPEGMSEEDGKKIVEECGTLADNEPCKTSYIRHICVFEKSRKKVWLQPVEEKS